MLDLLSIAFTLGLVSSLHCLGMCGPIAFALPLNRNSWANKISGIALYNASRILTYGVLGALFGLLGKAFFTAGFQRTLSIVVGLGFVLWAVLPWLGIRLFSLEKWSYSYISRFIGKARSWFKRGGTLSLFIIGIFNGILPCGMVYLALAGAVSSGNAADGFLFLVFFGLGTLPMMFLAGMSYDWFPQTLRSKFRKAVPVFILILGILFFLRGMNLGIPYISPVIDKVESDITSCD